MSTSPSAAPHSSGLNQSEASIIISTNQRRVLRSRDQLSPGQLVAGQLVVVAPEQAGEGDVDEGGGEALLQDVQTNVLLPGWVVPEIVLQFRHKLVQNLENKPTR